MVLVVAGCLPIVASDARIARVVEAQFVRTRLLSALIVLASIGPFCALLGYLTPRLIDQWAGGNPRQGGRAYGINILGCILGPLVASYFLLPWLREGHALLILSGPL